MVTRLSPAILRAMAEYLERHAQRDPTEVKFMPPPSAPSLQHEMGYAPNESTDGRTAHSEESNSLELLVIYQLLTVW